MLPAGPAGHVHMAAAEAAPPADSYGKLAEMKVELAWLADPATFPYRLGARADGASLEVRGYVPNEAVREQALKLAREHSGLNVVDSLMIHDHLALRSVGRPVEELQEAAQRVLAETLKDLVRGMRIKARPNGQVVVEGSVPSLESKVAVSQCLRKVGGCTGVVNQLELLALEQADGKTYTLVSADGRLMVPSEMLTPEPELAAPRMRTHEVVVQERPPVAPPVPVPAARPEPVKPRPQQTVSLVPRLDPAGTSVSAYELRETPPSAPSPQTSTPRAPTVPTVPRALPMEVSRPIEGASPPPPMFAPRQEPMPPPRVWNRPAVASEPGVKPSPEVTVKPVAPAPAPVPKAADAVVKSNPPASKTPAVQQAKAYVTTGTISFDDPVPTPKPAPAAVDLASLQTRLKQQIVSACCLSPRDLEVVATSDKTLDVRLKAPSIAQGELLSEKLFKMPELGPYEVRLDVQVSP
jgi:hypothetical protein